MQSYLRLAALVMNLRLDHVETARPALLIALALLLGGCPTRQQMSQVDANMSREQAISIMGRPDGDRIVGDNEALTYSNRLMSGWSWDCADYQGRASEWNDVLS
jgi:hypothetical protein